VGTNLEFGGRYSVVKELIPEVQLESGSVAPMTTMALSASAEPTERVTSGGKPNVYPVLNLFAAFRKDA